MFDFLKKLLMPSFESISTSELEDVLKSKKVTLLDVRSPQEYRGGHIRHARNIPLNQVETYQGPKSEKLYVICQSGMRSKRSASILARNGYQAINVRGGMSVYQGKIIGGK